LGRQPEIDGHALANGIRVQQPLASISAQAAASAQPPPVGVVLRQRQPFVQPARPEEQGERAPELAAHRAVQDEVDARINKRQDVHEVT